MKLFGYCFEFVRACETMVLISDFAHLMEIPHVLKSCENLWRLSMILDQRVHSIRTGVLLAIVIARWSPARDTF
jgi:hypothetical protein